MPLPLMRILTVAGVAGAAWAWRNPERARQMWGRVQQRTGLGQRPAEGFSGMPGMTERDDPYGASASGSTHPTSSSSAYAPASTTNPPGAASTGTGSAGESMSGTTGPSPAGI